MLSLHHTKPFSYRPEIDGLRALAVLAVIINHFQHDVLPSGFLGVDIFFVISGFVITGALTTRIDQPIREFLLDFYRRRFKRIFPALTLFIFIASLFVAVLDPTPRSTLKTGLFALIGASNLYLYSQSTDYFSESADLNAFTHTWSLGVEEQFYLIFPFLFWVLVKKRRTLIPILVFLSLLSLICFIASSFESPSFAYFSPFTRFWELAAGSIAFGIASRTSFRTDNPIVANAAFSALVLCLLIPADQARWATIIVVFLTALLLVLVEGTSATRIVLSMRLPVLIGKISFSLYLWHWFVLWLSRLTIGVAWWTVPYQLGLMFALAILSYAFVENPLRTRPWSASSTRSFSIAALSLGAVALMIVALDVPLRGKFYLGHITGQPLPQHLQRTWWVDKATGENLEPCHVHGYEKTALDRCLHNSSLDQRLVYLIGDSHARNYLPAVQAVFSKHTVRYLTIGHGCAFLDNTTAQSLQKYGCPDYVREVEDFITRFIKPGDVVVIGQRLFEVSATRYGLNYFAKLAEFSNMLAQKHAALILLDGVVPPAFQPERCLDVPWRRAELHGCTLPVSTVKNSLAYFDAAAKALQRDHSNVFFVPLRVGLCARDECGQTLKDGTPIWHDRGHITRQAAEALAPNLRIQLEEQHFPF